MKKTSILRIIQKLIFIVVFNILFFVIIGIENNSSVWLSYGFIHFAYFMLILTEKLIRDGISMAIFRFSLYSISTTYFFIQLVTGIVFILISPERYTITLLVQLCLAGIYGIIFIAHMVANERTANAEKDRKIHIEFIKDASVKLKKMLEDINDRETKKKIEQVYDAVYSSPVKSQSSLTELENEILQKIYKLETTVSKEDKGEITFLTDSLLSAINERNAFLKSRN